MRYALYDKDRSTAADASKDHADLHSRIATLFATGSQAGPPTCPSLPSVSVIILEPQWLFAQRCVRPSVQPVT